MTFITNLTIFIFILSGRVSAEEKKKETPDNAPAIIPVTLPHSMSMGIDRKIVKLSIEIEDRIRLMSEMKEKLALKNRKINNPHLDPEYKKENQKLNVAKEDMDALSLKLVARSRMKAKKYRKQSDMLSIKLDKIAEEKAAPVEAKLKKVMAIIKGYQDYSDAMMTHFPNKKPLNTYAYYMKGIIPFVLKKPDGEDYNYPDDIKKIDAYDFLLF